MADSKKYELYVEGRNDQCTIASIGYQKGLKPNKDKYELKFGDNIVAIKYNQNNQSGSDDTAYKMLQDALTTPKQYGAIAIIVDADALKNKNAQDRLKRFIEIVNKVNESEIIYDTTISLKSEGIILEPNSKYADIFPRVGLWIMPDNQNAGAIEHFLWKSGVNPDYINTYNAVEKVVNEYEQDQSDPPIIHYISNHHNKALVHTFLAWVEDPGNPMGQSVDKKCWNINSAIVNDFMNWLSKVYC